MEDRTRYRIGKCPSLPDLVIKDENYQAELVTHLPTLDESDRTLPSFGFIFRWPFTSSGSAIPRCFEWINFNPLNAQTRGRYRVARRDGRPILPRTRAKNYRIIHNQRKPKIRQCRMNVPTAFLIRAQTSDYFWSAYALMMKFTRHFQTSCWSRLYSSPFVPVDQSKRQARSGIIRFLMIESPYGQQRGQSPPRDGNCRFIQSEMIWSIGANRSRLVFSSDGYIL